MNARHQKKTNRYTVERRGGRGFGRLHECSGTPPTFDFVKTRWGAGDYRIRRFDTDTSRWRVVDSFSVAEDSGVAEAETTTSEGTALREVVDLLRAQSRQMASFQERLQQVEQERRHPIEDVLQSLAYMEELRTRLAPRASNPPGDDGVLGNLAKGFGAMMMAAQNGTPGEAPAWSAPFAAMDASRAPRAHVHHGAPSAHHRSTRPPASAAAPRQPSLPGMTPDIERELVEYSQMMGIPWEAGITQARSQGWNAGQLLGFARGHIERMTTPKPESTHDAPSS